MSVIKKLKIYGIECDTANSSLRVKVGYSMHYIFTDCVAYLCLILFSHEFHEGATCHTSWASIALKNSFFGARIISHRTVRDGGD